VTLRDELLHWLFMTAVIYITIVQMLTAFSECLQLNCRMWGITPLTRSSVSVSKISRFTKPLSRRGFFVSAISMIYIKNIYSISTNINVILANYEKFS
jgi:hypothetical protein